jgi:hypothetical protein
LIPDRADIFDFAEQTGSVTYIVSYAMDTRSSFLNRKVARM